MFEPTKLPAIYELLYASLVCNMKPDGPPAHRMQLFFTAHQILGSHVHQKAFQRALQTGVDEHKYWNNYSIKGSGEYIITKEGLDEALSCFSDDESCRALYLPQKKIGCHFSMFGNYKSYKIHYRQRNGNSEIYINNRPMKSSEACELLKIDYDKESAFVSLYDFCIDNEFEKCWEGLKLSAFDNN